MILAALLALQPLPADPARPLPPGLTACADGSALREGPCPVMLFFDSGENEIRREWLPVIDEAIRLAGEGGHFTVVGHSDRSGPAAANLAVSQRRAAIVRDALLAKGVARDRIRVNARGEDAPLVPTADGVREIQNRRVVIEPVP